MKTIYLLRHAEAQNATSPDADHDRPLSEKGRRDAYSLGATLKAEKISPAVTRCSDARRTRETLALMECGGTAGISRHLYLAEAETLLAEIYEAPPDAESLLIIAHNPGIAELAARLSGDRFLDLEGFPPATMGLFESSASAWEDISPGNTRLNRVLILR